jgi:hypothetical protein
VSPPLSKYCDDDESIEDATDTEWTEVNDVDWEEILNRPINYFQLYVRPNVSVLSSIVMHELVTVVCVNYVTRVCVN